MEYINHTRFSRHSQRKDGGKIQNCLGLFGSAYKRASTPGGEGVRGMEIRVRCGCGGEEGSCPEWAIVELQGVVESQPSVGNRIQDLEIGRLCCCSPQGSYTFTVGYHELSGTKLPLKKPLLVLKKKRAPADGEATDSSRVELEVIGIIRHRILFKNRPKALISRPQVKEKKIV